MPDTMKVILEKGDDVKITIDITYETCPMLMNNVVDLISSMLDKIKDMEAGKTISVAVSSKQKKEKRIGKG